MKEQQDAQIRNLMADVERMRGQKVALEERITSEQTKFKERRAKWLEEKKALQHAGEQARKQAYEARSQARRQAKVIAAKDKEVLDAKNKVKEGKQQLLDKELMLTKQRRWVENELQRAARIKATLCGANPEPSAWHHLHCLVFLCCRKRTSGSKKTSKPARRR